ncbi:hypothetical protein TRP8649_03289 [Pelagimonas phthalicica]|uniref:Uncharacterized protein n=1 Tax=Pelagimonas phthalicica TaxID=1037362 RepID=A0A238JH70_9RHOB|nr:hypothetical protein [Pelagimonas phthalicica]TDS92106.1 hypothetical protein CLV87_3289 [Pelagimonas phthalicica]SMX29156.1 hypothetical protein TRP8649_03289 [Pelagimonas phthalicica]
MFDFKTPNGAILRNATVEAARTNGVSEDEIAVVLKAERKRLVSEECRRRIYAHASAEAQTNMGLAVGVIGAKTASNRTDAEVAILAGATAALGWVQAMRAANAALIENAEADFLDDAAWPEIPAEAAQVAASF